MFLKENSTCVGSAHSYGCLRDGSNFECCVHSLFSTGIGTMKTKVLNRIAFFLIESH